MPASHTTLRLITILFLLAGILLLRKPVFSQAVTTAPTRFSVVIQGVASGKGPDVLLIPGLAQLTSPGPPGRSRLRQADRAYRDALTDLARQASLAALPHLQLSPAVITSQHAPCHQPSHTPQLDSKFKVPAGKDNLPKNSNA